MLQRETFAASEADRWFTRNQTALAERTPETDLPLRLLDLYHLSPRRVLEIGAANGWRLAEIAKQGKAARLVAVEPSMAAIEDGSVRFPAIEFRQGVVTATGLREQFDLVIVHYVLHWVDRAELLQAVAEIDRLVAEDGYLLVGDFSPDTLTRVPYHHRPDLSLFTWKQPYGALWLASGLYTEVAMLTNHHGAGLDPAPEDHERGALWLLRKRGGDRYREAG
jgi:SAM-dependent methyltransferase